MSTQVPPRDVQREARAAGARDAFGIPAAVLSAGMVGFGALVYASGLDIWIAIACTAGLWALPGQVVLVEMHVAGAPGVATIIAVMLTAVRFLPMTLTVMPLVRDENVRNGKLYATVQFVATSSWAWAVQRLPDMPREVRLSYFIGFGGMCWAVSVVGAAIGFYLAGSFPPLLRLGFIFLNPVYLVVLLLGDARTALAFVSLACGAIAGPLLHIAYPEWSVLLTGLIAGTTAYFIQRAWRRRHA